MNVPLTILQWIMSACASTTLADLCVINVVQCSIKSFGDLESSSLLTRANAANALDMLTSASLVSLPERKGFN